MIVFACIHRRTTRGRATKYHAPTGVGIGFDIKRYYSFRNAKLHKKNETAKFNFQKICISQKKILPLRSQIVHK